MVFIQEKSTDIHLFIWTLGGETLGWAVKLLELSGKRVNYDLFLRDDSRDNKSHGKGRLIHVVGSI